MRGTGEEPTHYQDDAAKYGRAMPAMLAESQRQLR